MSRPPSPATQIKNLRRALHEAQIDARAAKGDATNYRAKLDAMTKDRNEWKARFDKLLERMPGDPL